MLAADTSVVVHVPKAEITSQSKPDPVDRAFLFVICKGETRQFTVKYSAPTYPTPSLRIDFMVRAQRVFGLLCADIW